METYDFKVKNNEGKDEVLKVIDIISDTPFEKEYIIYKRENDEIIYASEFILKDDLYHLENIESEEELNYINEILSSEIND